MKSEYRQSETGSCNASSKQLDQRLATTDIPVSGAAWLYKFSISYKDTEEINSTYRLLRPVVGLWAKEEPSTFYFEGDTFEDIMV